MPDGDERQLGLIHHIELLLDVVEVRADGGGGDLQLVRDLLHRRARREADEHVELALRQPLHRRLGAALQIGERELLREVGIEITAAGGDRRHGLDQRFRRASL